MNKKLLVAVLSAMALAVTGCGSSNTAAENTGGAVTESPATTENNESATVTVEHSLGTTEVPKNPKNIVVMDYGMLDALDALGVEVAGIPLSSTLPSYLEHLSDESAYTNVGSLKEIDMEKVFEIEPELIIIGGRQASYYEELSKIAPTINLAVDASNYLESFTTSMNYLGEIFDKEAEVAEKVEAVEASIMELSAKAADKNVNGLIALANGDGFSVYGADSRFGIIHNEFGITPVDTTIVTEAQHGQNASFEYVVEQNPDYLFVVDRTAATTGEGSAKELFSNDLMKTTAAYQNDRIIYLDATIWYTVTGGITSTQMMVDEITTALEK